MAEQNPQVFMDVSISKVRAGRIIFELFPKIAPATVQNFIALCTGEKGIGKITGKPLHYKGSFFYDTWKGFSFVKDGDLLSSYEEMPSLPLNERGLLAINICDRFCLGSHFIITVRPDHHLDRFHIVFGRIVKGLETLDKITRGPWVADVIVSDCGIYDLAETRVGKRKSKEYLPEKKKDETRKGDKNREKDVKIVQNGRKKARGSC